MNKIVRYIKKALGITSLEIRIADLNNENQSIGKKLDEVRSISEFINTDNKLILSHIRFLNSQFFVSADIGDPKHQQNVMIVFKKGKEQIVKTYQFSNQTVEEIHRILEGFGIDNTVYDQPRGWPAPQFRY